MSVVPPASYLTGTIWTANNLKPRKSLQSARQERELQFKCPNVTCNVKDYMWPKGIKWKESVPAAVSLALEETMIKHVM